VCVCVCVCVSCGLGCRAEEPLHRAVLGMPMLAALRRMTRRRARKRHGMQLLGGADDRLTSVSNGVGEERSEREV
jgi:hypothetical protein